MKDFSFQILPNRSRKTVSDLKLKKSIQLTAQDLARINNTYKCKGPKLSPIIGEITGIPIKAQSALIRQMLLGKQVTKLQTPFKRITTIQETETVYIKTVVREEENDEVLQDQLTQKVARQVQQEQKPSQRSQSEVLNPQKKVKSPRKIYSKMVTLPRIEQAKYQTQRRFDKPILSAIDVNLKALKSLHYYIVQHESKAPIIAYRSRTKIEVASLTKIMTFYTVYKISQEFSLNLRQSSLTIEQSMTGITGTTALLEEEQVYTIEQLLYGMMLPSGNDASIALATWAGRILLLNYQNNENNSYATGGVKAFVQRMNKQAKQLRMIDTSYGNPHGLPHKDNKTTCEDVARLCSQCLNIPLFRQVVGTKVYRFKFYHLGFKRKLQSHWQNTNKLLRRPGFIGIKTGITVTAGPCLASAYQFIGKTYIVIIAKCNKPSRRFKQTRKLLAHCLQRIPHARPLTQDDEKVLKRLSRKNEDIDSDYSDEEVQFNFASFSQQQIQRRARILTQI